MENELDIVAKHVRQAPVDLDAIFAELGIRYRAQPIRSGESGWIERAGDGFDVVVNANESEQRRRFTAAHELAHYLLHRDLLAKSGRMNRHTDRLYSGADDDADSAIKPHHEVQANRLAAQIIMPASLVREKVLQGLGSAELAEAFKVSKPAMEIRLKTLGL